MKSIRPGLNFAVADAYRHWSDVKETEADELFKRFWEKAEKPNSRV